MSNEHADPIAAAVSELDSYGTAVADLRESVSLVYEHGTDLVESRRRLLQLLDSAAQEMRDLVAQRDRDRQRHESELSAATQRRDLAEARQRLAEQRLALRGVLLVPGDRVRIGKCTGTVVPDAVTVRVRLDGGTEAGRFSQEFVHPLSPRDDPNAAALEETPLSLLSAGPDDEAEFQHKAEELARLNATVHTVRRLADVASRWPFNKGGHLWQAHEKRDFAKWLREMANKINKGEEW